MVDQGPADLPYPSIPSLGDRAKLGEETAKYLRDAILAGAYLPGQRVAISDVATRLGVSTMPVREALVALASEGMLEALPRRGFRVSTIRRRDIEDTFRVHAFVAGCLAEAAAPAITEEDLANLRELQRQIESFDARDRHRGDPTIEELNFSFHSAINHVPDAPRLRWYLRAATRSVPRHFYESIPGWVETTHRDHPAIIRALEARDGTAARDLIVAHVERAGDLVVANLSEHRPRSQVALTHALDGKA